MKDNVLLKLKPSWLVAWKKYIVFILVLILWVFISNENLNKHITKDVTIFHVLIGITILSFFYCLIHYFKIYTISYIITDQRIIFKEGILIRNEEQTELYRVVDYKIISPLLLNIFGLSNIYIYSSDRNDPTIILQGVKNAEELRDIIRDNVEKMRLEKRVFQIS